MRLYFCRNFKISNKRANRIKIMRFGRNMRHLAIPEWKQCYLDYEHLKIFIRLIKRIVQTIHYCERQQSAVNRTSVEEGVLIEEPSQTIIDVNIKQLERIGEEVNELFFDAHIKSMAINRLFLHMKLMQMREYFNKCQTIFLLQLEKNEVALLMQILQFIYIETSLVQSAKELNLQGERKILKKHTKYADQLFETPRRRNKKVVRISRQLDKLLADMEDFYVKHTPGSTKENRDRLRELSKKIQSSNSDSFVFGSWVGICVSILGVLITILSYTGKSIQTDFIFNRDFPTWRGIAIFIIYIWTLGMNVYVYESYSISHRVVFQYNQHHYSTSTTIFKIAGFFSTFFVIMFAIYTLQIASLISLPQVSPHYLVLFVWGIFILYLINPFPIFSFHSRLYGLKIAIKSILAPFLGVTFPVIWMTDQLISLITPFRDFAYTICYYINLTDEGSVNSRSNTCNSAKRFEVVFMVGAIAYFFRIVQCMRQGYDKGSYFCELEFLNTIKYAFSLITLTLSFLWKAGDDTIFNVWIVFACLSTLYSYIWDLKVDWALFEKNSPHRFLRKNLCYPYQAYYVIILVNFLLRIVWVGTLSQSIANNAFGSPQIFSLVTGVLEIFRRGIWNMLRVERQHIANCRNFKATPSMINSLQHMIMESLKKRKSHPKSHIQESTEQQIEPKPEPEPHLQNSFLNTSQNPRELQITEIQQEIKMVKEKHLEFLYEIIELDFKKKSERVAKAKKLKKKIEQIEENVIKLCHKEGKSNKIMPIEQQC